MTTPRTLAAIPSKLARAIRVAAINVAVLAGLLIVVEGIASAVLVLRAVAWRPWADRSHLRYDAALGWVGRENSQLPDGYGRGIWIHINAQGFRATGDVAPTVAPGRYRVICSGDSFTFGEGVDNEHTWCEQLRVRDARIEPVNLGQGGYGADQSYLRFVRDTRGLQHHIHLFAFITDDFLRMQSSTFFGRSKPVLAVEAGRLVQRNVPVPRLGMALPWLVAIPRAVEMTRLATLARGTAEYFHLRDSSATTRDADIRAVLRLMFADLKRMNDARSSRLVLVHLPTVGDVYDADSAGWAKFVRETGRELGVPVIDAIEAFRSRTDDLDNLFVDERYTSAGHYSHAGNALVADVIAERLKAYLPGGN